MSQIELKISEDSSISKVKTDILILKNITDGVFGPEKEIDDITKGAVSKVNKKEFCQLGRIIRLKESTDNANCILLMGMGEIDLIDYDSIRYAFGQAFKFISDNFSIAESVSTVIHGVGFGLEKRDIFNQLIKGLLDIYGKKEDVNLKRLVINENGTVGRPEILLHIKDLADIGSNLFFHKEDTLYIRMGRIGSSVAVYSEIKANSKEFLIRGEIIKAINQIRKVDDLSIDIDLDLLESRHNTLARENRLRTIDDEYYNLELNRIRKSVLEILSTL